MEIQQLIDGALEQKLQLWLQRFSDAVEALKHIEELFAGLNKPTIQTEVGEHVSISGPVHIGKGTKIHPFVTIEGPVVIGENVSIRSHSIIRNYAYIGSTCVVGHSADVKRRNLFERRQNAMRGFRWG